MVQSHLMDIRNVNAVWNRDEIITGYFFSRLLVLIFREKLQCEKQLGFMAQFGVNNSVM